MFFGRYVRVLATTALAFLLLISASCGGSSASSKGNDPQSGIIGPLSGNWQLILLQQEPTPATELLVSGFLQESNNTFSGSVSGPNIVNSSGTLNCGGVSQLTGTANGKNVTFSMSPGGTVFTFTGTISGDYLSMSGDYQAQGGACFTAPLVGTWNAFLIPPLNGSFTGTLSNSSYMADLTGISPAAPISVSGTMTQSPNIGASNATLTGTISATGYPCFSTVSVSGTISGQNVILSVFGYNGSQIGVLGSPATPAIVSSTPNGPLLSNGDLSLGKATATTVVGPCPALNVGSGSTVTDSTVVSFSFQ